MALYVGREDETREFLRLGDKRRSSLVVCHGRRRIGKSTFFRKCAEKLDHFLTFEGLAPRAGSGRGEQLSAFSRQLSAQTSLPHLPLDNWPQAFQLLASVLPERGWTLLLLDEVSWMAAGEPDFAGHLKIAWDLHFATRDRLIVALCGSVSSWIEQNILNSTGFVGRCSWELALPPLSLPSCNAFWGGKRVAATEKLKLLAITGGVPRYLEEIDPIQSAAENAHRLCFEPGGLLFREFEQIFHDIFNRRAGAYKTIVQSLASGSKTVSEIASAIQNERGGTLSRALGELEKAGFLVRDVTFDLRTGKDRPRGIRYRLSDNYLRFYLRYVAPNRSRIAKGLFRDQPLESLTAWDTILGLQLENLLLENLPALRRRLGLERTVVLNAGPYQQSRTARRRGCQIDALVQTKDALYVVELKVRRQIPASVVADVQRKVDALDLPPRTSVHPILVYEGQLPTELEHDTYFDRKVAFGELFEG